MNICIRQATLADLEQISALESACFPVSEAASKAAFTQRLQHFSDFFWLLFLDDQLVSFVDGLVSHQENLTDEMYANAKLHQKDADWWFVLGLDTSPAYQKQGFASRVLNHAISEVKAQGKKGVVLTCKDELVDFYAKFGFIDEGYSTSEHGGVRWHQVRLRF